MANYENQADMFRQRAEKCKQSGDQYYAQAMKCKASDDGDNYKKYMAQAQNQYKLQKENEAKAKAHAGKSW